MREVRLRGVVGGRGSIHIGRLLVISPLLSGNRGKRRTGAYWQSGPRRRSGLIAQGSGFYECCEASSIHLHSDRLLLGGKNWVEGGQVHHCSGRLAVARVHLHPHSAGQRLHIGFTDMAIRPSFPPPPPYWKQDLSQPPKPPGTGQYSQFGTAYKALAR